MKKNYFTFAILLAFLPSFAQINEVSDLTWWHNYHDMHNFFMLEWQAPATPHDELLGYNVYRNNELYRFQTDDFIGFTELGNNCGEDFIAFGDGTGFFAHVTAVYSSGESGFLETAQVGPPLLKVAAFDNRKAVVYPNPTGGLLHIGNPGLQQIEIYDLAGKKIKTFGPQPQIDLSDLSKGTYLIRLSTDQGTVSDRIIIE